MAEGARACPSWSTAQSGDPIELEMRFLCERSVLHHLEQVGATENVGCLTLHILDLAFLIRTSRCKLKSELVSAFMTFPSRFEEPLATALAFWGVLHLGIVSAMSRPQACDLLYYWLFCTWWIRLEYDVGLCNNEWCTTDWNPRQIHAFR